MAGFVEIGDNKYIGTVKLVDGSVAVKNGQFVAVNWANSTGATPVNNTSVAYFVENVIDTVDEQMIDDVDFEISANGYLRLKRFKVGEFFITDQAQGTVNVNDVVDVGVTGKITATSGTPNQKFRVIAKPTMWGKTVYRCIVLD